MRATKLAWPPKTSDLGTHAVVDQFSGVESLYSRFRKVPMGTVESVSVIDHARHEAGVAAAGIRVRGDGVREYGLAAVGIAHPFVEHQDGAEVLQIGHLGQQGVGEKIVDGYGAGVARILRAELPAGLDIHPPRDR